MKIKRDNQGVISVQIKPKERYCILFHRLNKGKYEQYIKRHNGIYVLNADELKEIHKFIQNLEVEKYDNRGKKSKTKRGSKKI